jgi:hypothetical protein
MPTINYLSERKVERIIIDPTCTLNVYRNLAAKKTDREGE